MEEKEPGDTPNSLSQNVFKMAIDLMLDNGFTPKSILEIFNGASVSLMRDEIEELLDLPKNYLVFSEEKQNNIVNLKDYRDI